MKIVEYKNALDIVVEFQDEYKAKIHTQYGNFKKGQVKNPYYPYVFNVGYIGQGKYTHKTHKEIYQKWHQMIKRCYDPHYLNRKPTYRDVFVCDEWLCFQNFAKWYEDNYYKCNNEIMELDKDILVKHNKIYSPETCIYVPQTINKLFVKSDKTRGDSVIGTSLRKNGKYQVRCSLINPETGKSKNEYLGLYDTQEKAFEIYKYYKEKNIKEVSDYYKEQIPDKLYNALYNYKVEITD